MFLLLNNFSICYFWLQICNFKLINGCSCVIGSIKCVTVVQKNSCQSILLTFSQLCSIILNDNFLVLLLQHIQNALVDLSFLFRTLFVKKIFTLSLLLELWLSNLCHWEQIRLFIEKIFVKNRILGYHLWKTLSYWKKHQVWWLLFLVDVVESIKMSNELLELIGKSLLIFVRFLNSISQFFCSVDKWVS